MKTGDTVAWVIVDNHGNVLEYQFETRADARAEAKQIMKEENADFPHKKLKLRIARVVLDK